MTLENQTYETTIDIIGGVEIDVIVTYNFTAGRAATMYDRNGDPGSPAEDSEVEILSVVWDDGHGTDVLQYLDPERLEDLEAEICIEQEAV
jgi:hypothetical protein